MTSENAIKKAISDYLYAHRVFAWRNNTGASFGSYKGKQRFFRFGEPGSGDIFALHRGKFVSIETKAPGKHPTNIQVDFMQRVRENGGLTMWTDDVDDFIDWWTNQFPIGD